MSSEPQSNHPPPPVRVTSGAGFDFEDRVGAWLLVKMLVGEPMPAIDGQGQVLQAQTSALEWKIDDLLVSSRQDDGSERKLALSCKGNVQVSGSGLPADFVAAAWKQWQHDKVPLRSTGNALALVTAARHADFDEIWREVKHACGGADTALGLGRILKNPKQSRVFNSVRAKSPTEQATPEATVELIRHLHVLPIELHAADGARENEAIGQCRGLLASRDLTEARDVWDTLQGIAKKTRLEDGTVTLLQVWERLRARFALLHHPDFAADWSILTAHATEERDRVETVLPNGHALERAAIAAELAEALGAQVITLVAGESGSGKSGLVKRYLAQHFPEATPLWLGNETATMLVSPVQRTAAGIKHTLRELLSWTTGRENVLVLDAAERLDDVALSALAKGLEELVIGAATDAPPPWRVVVTTQPQALSRIATAFAGYPVRPVEVGALSPGEVKAAVRDSSGLAWLTAHEATIGALTSLKALAWVLRAGASLGPSPNGFASHIDVVDRLWLFWTRDDVPSAVLLMKLGEREAGSERSFAISSLEPGQQQAFQAAREWLPLRLDPATNHLRFEHDLAADWSRFQRLKELSSDPQAWAPLASNPLWTNALRLLGQHLLRREASAGTAWDEAYPVDTAHSGLVQGLLLDAICLDPQAEHFLTQRADWLLENRGRRFDQLLTRFHHIATVPPQAISASGGWIELYAEAHRRVIVTGRWLPVLRFVLAQTSKLPGLLSSALARLTHTWLTQTPVMLGDDRATPFRQELADLAVAVVRTIQVHHGSGDILCDLEPEFYAAALAGMADRPAQVAELALELSGRRAIDGQTAAQIQAIVRDRQTQHERLLAADPVRRANHEAARKMGSMSLGRQKLPPWPIGAKYGVDRDFRKACFKSGILEPVMRAAPAIAAEVLLALIVEDKPEREFDAGRHPYRERLGLDYPIDATVPIFWKSPFWPFLQIASDQAVDALLQLVQFCTERWADGTRGSRGTGLAISIAGTERSFVGDADVLAWSQSTSAQTGNLHGALDSLERWLVTRIDAGLDVSATVSRLLSGSTSLAIVGVLINVGKHHPALFEGPLSALLSNAELYAWDDVRVEHVDYNFSSNFVSAGEQLFDLAKSWVLAPHRRLDLTNAVIGLVRSNPALADVVRGWTAQWPKLGDARSSLEQRITAARLDSANYQTNEDGVVVCVVPADLAEEMRAWADTHAPSSQQLTTPYACQQLLDADQPIDDEKAAALCAVLETPPHEEPWVQARCERAVAGTLTVLAPDWLARNGGVQSKVESIFEAAMASLPSTADALREARFPSTHNGMDFVAIALVRQWVREASPEAGQRVIQLLTSGDRRAANSLVAAAYLQRQRLGDRWWRLLYVGVLWSGLSMLAPRYGDAAAVELVWAAWWRRLRRVSLSAPCGPGDLDIARVDEGCARLMRRRQMRAYVADSSRRNPMHLVGASLDTQALDGLFHWLLRGSGSGNPELDLTLVSRFWDLEVAHARDCAKEDDGELQMSGQLAYHLVEKLADLALADLPSGGRPAWLQVLELGPAAHNAVHHLVSSLFVNLSKGADPQRFEMLWQALAEYALAADWRMPGLWFYGDQLRRSILGFGGLWALDKLRPGAALRMQATFGTWAKDHLTGEDDLAAFSLFLASPFAAALRFEGLVWIDTALKAPKASFGFHRDACGDALIELILTLLQSDQAALRKRAEARAALLSIAAALAATGRPDALAMQDRLRAALMG